MKLWVLIFTFLIPSMVLALPGEDNGFSYFNKDVQVLDEIFHKPCIGVAKNSSLSEKLGVFGLVVESKLNCNNYTDEKKFCSCIKDISSKSEQDDLRGEKTTGPIRDAIKEQLFHLKYSRLISLINSRHESQGSYGLKDIGSDDEQDERSADYCLVDEETEGVPSDLRKQLESSEINSDENYLHMSNKDKESSRLGDVNFIDSFFTFALEGKEFNQANLKALGESENFVEIFKKFKRSNKKYRHDSSLSLMMSTRMTESSNADLMKEFTKKIYPKMENISKANFKAANRENKFKADVFNLAFLVNDNACTSVKMALKQVESRTPEEIEAELNNAIDELFVPEDAAKSFGGRGGGRSHRIAPGANLERLKIIKDNILRDRTNPNVKMELDYRFNYFYCMKTQKMSKKVEDAIAHVETVTEDERNRILTVVDDINGGETRVITTLNEISILQGGIDDTYVGLSAFEKRNLHLGVDLGKIDKSLYSLGDYDSVTYKETKREDYNRMTDAQKEIVRNNYIKERLFREQQIVRQRSTISQLQTQLVTEQEDLVRKGKQLVGLVGGDVELANTLTGFRKTTTHNYLKETKSLYRRKTGVYSREDIENHEGKFASKVSKASSVFGKDGMVSKTKIKDEISSKSAFASIKPEEIDNQDKKKIMNTNKVLSDAKANAEAQEKVDSYQDGASSYITDALKGINSRLDKADELNASIDLDKKKKVNKVAGKLINQASTNSSELSEITELKSELSSLQDKYKDLVSGNSDAASTIEEASKPISQNEQIQNINNAANKVRGVGFNKPKVAPTPFGNVVAGRSSSKQLAELGNSNRNFIETANVAIPIRAGVASIANISAKTRVINKDGKINLPLYLKKVETENAVLTEKEFKNLELYIGRPASQLGLENGGELLVKGVSGHKVFTAKIDSVGNIVKFEMIKEIKTTEVKSLLTETQAAVESLEENIMSYQDLKLILDENR